MALSRPHVPSSAPSAPTQPKAGLPVPKAPRWSERKIGFDTSYIEPGRYDLEILDAICKITELEQKTIFVLECKVLKAEPVETRDGPVKPGNRVGEKVAVVWQMSGTINDQGELSRVLGRVFETDPQSIEWNDVLELGGWTKDEHGEFQFTHAQGVLSPLVGTVLACIAYRREKPRKDGTPSPYVVKRWNVVSRSAAVLDMMGASAES